MPQAVAHKGRPTLAIAVGLGWGVRNYLLSDCFPVLASHFNLLILAPYARLPGFREHFEGLDARVVAWSESPQPMLARALFELADTAYAHRRPTTSRLLRAEQTCRRCGRLLGTSLRWLGSPLFPALRLLYRRQLKRRWPAVAELRQLFQREQVDALFSTNCCEPSEWAAVLAARAGGLPVVTAITSWDNPSTKPFLICDYHGYLAWGPLMRDHLQRHLDVRDAARIHLTGPPQFDFYFREEFHRTREEFCREHGLDPARKIVVYSTGTPAIVPDEPENLKHVHDLWHRDLPGEPQLLVRIHPKDRLERYAGLRHDPHRQGIVWTLAGAPKLAEKDQWCPDPEDLHRAVNTVRHGDVNVHCRYSTMMLDFAALDKPVLVIAYDSRGSTARSLDYEKYEHLRPVVRSGGVRIVYTPEEMERQLRLALESPEMDREARARLIHQQLGELDGRAGERSGRAVVEIVQAALQRRPAAA